jgi:hypothetical protein
VIRTPYQEACGGLVRYRMFDEPELAGCVRDAQYFARGLGWVSYDSARNSWDPGEQRDVAAWRAERLP